MPGKKKSAQKSSITEAQVHKCTKVIDYCNTTTTAEFLIAATKERQHIRQHHSKLKCTKQPPLLSSWLLQCIPKPLDNQSSTQKDFGHSELKFTRVIDYWSTTTTTAEFLIVAIQESQQMRQQHTKLWTINRAHTSSGQSTSQKLLFLLKETCLCHP